MTRLFPAPALPGPSSTARACIPAACLVLACILGACAPQDISTGSSERADREYYRPEGPSSQDALRLPMPASGGGKERYLYYASKPTVMENMQNWNRQRLYGSAQAERDRLLSAPKRRSPFRQ